MTTPPTQPAEGELIETARARRVPPGTSVNQIAKRAGITGSRWRQIERGYSSRAGMYVAEKSKPETLAAMAQVVRVTPEELRKAGREDAAKILEAALAIEAHNETTDGPGLVWDPVDEGDLHGIGLALASVPPERREMAKRVALNAIKAMQETEEK